MSPLLNKLLIALGVVVVGFGLYMFFSKSDETPIGEVQGVVSSADLLVASEKIYTDLNKIRTLSIDSPLFSDKRFTSLIDARVDLVDVATGRTNPFAPVE
jgi:hypothetical protein